MDKCMTCGEQLLAGTPYVSLDLHRETSDGYRVKVIEAHALRIWCEHCALGVFGSVCCDDSHLHKCPEDKEIEEMLATLSEDDATRESPPSADPRNTIEVYLAGLAKDDPDIMEEARGHMLSLVADGNTKFLTVLLEAIRNGLSDS